MLYIDIDSPVMNTDSYVQLLKYCFNQSKYFSLAVREFPLLNLSHAFQNELIPFVIKEIDTYYWFSYSTEPGEEEKRIVYSTNNNAQEIIRKYSDNLFFFEKQKSNKHKTTRGWDQTVEDLCFFSDDKLLLGTVSHEYICEAFPPDEEFEAKLFEIYPHWLKGDNYSQQIKLSDYM